MTKKNIRVLWDSNSEHSSKYANQFYISHSGYEDFHLIFGHLEPLNTTNLNEDEIPDIAKIKTVAKIVINPDKMGEILKVMNKNYEDFLKAKEGKNNGN